MEIKNKSGPSTLPCGMPLITGLGTESSPLTLTTWSRPVRKALIQDSILPSMPFAFNLVFNLLCGTVSNALEKSK